ncbi:MAG: glucokinase [Proteobacteria bacterium]|nr:glucokinase [Pseudomonadota bacterium]
MTKTLVADIGGTNARFARVDASGIHDEHILKVADYEGPVAAAEAYLKQAGGAWPEAATFAVAGPVTGDSFTLTNHPWTFTITGTKKALRLSHFDLINDFHAMALGVLKVDADKCLQFGSGIAQVNGNRGIIGPGTGLGVASLVWDARGGYYVPVPSEGPHVTLPVKTDREWAVVKWLLTEKYSHVSAERVCSGKGLLNLYEAICGVDGKIPAPLDPEMITSRALAKTCPICVEVLDMMLGFLGRIAGNLALVSNALGGVYFCAGILPKLGLAVIEDSRLRHEFVSKGRMTAHLEAMPTFLVTDTFLPLKGLHTHALGLTR